MALAGIWQLAVYCVLGTLVEHSVNVKCSSILGTFSNNFVFIQGSGIYDALCSLDWNLLSVEEQAAYCFLAQHAMKSPVFYVADFKPVNMETYLAVSPSFLDMEPIKLYLCIFQTIKSILSYTMVMVSLYN